MPLWVILFYCAYSFSNNTKVMYDSDHGRNSFFLFYVFTIVEYLLFAIFIYTVLGRPVLRKALIVCSALFTSFCLFNIFSQPKYHFDSLQTSIESLILLIFCILFFFEQINKPQVVFIYSSYKFWIVTGILIYLAATFFLYGFAASLPKGVANEYWPINYFSNILRNVFFTVALLIQANAPKKPAAPTSMEPDYQPFLN